MAYARPNTIARVGGREISPFPSRERPQPTADSLAGWGLGGAAAGWIAVRLRPRGPVPGAAIGAVLQLVAVVLISWPILKATGVDLEDCIR